MEKNSAYPTLPNEYDVPPQYNSAVMPGMVDQSQFVGNAPVAPPPQPVYIMQAPVQQNFLGTKPTTATCPSCGAREITKVTYRANNKTHIIAVILMAVACCCCIPYCFDSCKSAEHNCSNCGSYLGSCNN